MHDMELEWLIAKKARVKTEADDTKRSTLFDQSNLSKWFHLKKRAAKFTLKSKIIFFTENFCFISFDSHWKIQTMHCKFMKKKTI